MKRQGQRGSPTKNAIRPRDSDAKVKMREEAQIWLRRMFRLSKPSVIQTGDEGFHFVFNTEKHTYFCSWSDKARDLGLDLMKAKIS